ncbi:phosphonate ABC transporter, permease protein PhnE [Barrientosiimonas endolithica]|uniref:Phosphonate transporter PhnE n=1 Tax=Barrientosiimonas endolithica TaxID=1535208 RepID=A0ABM8H831_9MICO|nr:phosphonate ABC transporter, permease protein PhnE [Barrientosiimonas endolithica]BDZ57019.1 phosphonate transporter PhnE [Barrientosiimonas endolithica]
MTTLTGSARTLPVPADPRRGRRRALVATLLTVLVAAHVAAFLLTDVSPSLLVTGWQGMAAFLADTIPPDLDWATVLRPAIEASLITLAIGLLGTTLSIPFSLALAAVAARGTAHPAAYHAARWLLSVLRAVPDIVFALIFVTAVGLGPFAGILAIICHNTGVMGKLWAESMEDVDPGPGQALATAGASPSQRIANATLPQVMPQWVGLLLYRFDVNVRSSLVLGLVGAGGIGLLITRSIKTFQFDQMLTQILVVLVLIVAVDQLSAGVRRRLAA